MRYVNYAHRGASSYAPENTLMAFYKALFFNGADQIKQFLGSANGKRRDHHIATPVKGLLQDLRKLPNIIRSRAVKTVTVGRFDHHIIRLLRHLRITDQGSVGITQVTGK